MSETEAEMREILKRVLGLADDWTRPRADVGPVTRAHGAALLSALGMDPDERAKRRSNLCTHSLLTTCGTCVEPPPKRRKSGGQRGSEAGCYS